MGILVAAIVATVVLASVASLVDTLVLPRDSPIVHVGSAIAFAAVGLALYTVSVTVVYRLVPPRPPAWRALGVPALVISAIFSIFTNVFVQVQAQLLGSLELFAGFIVVLATMIWLSIGFQILLLGAAWIRVRNGPAPSS